MAYKDNFEGDALNNAADLRFFWNVHEDVGWGCRNRPDDVMLVQYLLRRTMHNVVEVYQQPSLPTKKDLVVDGIFGPQTHKWIRAYQSLMSNYFHQDGKVDAIDGTRKKSTKQHRLYTIIALNLDFIDNDYLYFYDLRMDPNLPPFLAQALTQSMGSDPVIVN
jgi:hypothetical protein